MYKRQLDDGLEKDEKSIVDEILEDNQNSDEASDIFDDNDQVDNDDLKIQDLGQEEISDNILEENENQDDQESTDESELEEI